LDQLHGAVEIVLRRELRQQLYKKRNEVERGFRRLKGFSRIFSRFEEIEVVI
jgi:transposase